MSQPADGVENVHGAEVLVAGVVRNCAAHLPCDVARLQASLRAFRRLSWLLIESDSDDDSGAVLSGLASKIEKFRFLSLGNLKAAMPRRTERIAHCRNLYIDEIRNNPLYATTDYVVVADFDGVNSLISEEGILSCWSRDDWDVCTANQRAPYYDVWALRHGDWSPNDCWQQRRFLKRYNRNDDELLRACIYARMITIPEDDDWIEVDSAFGGFAVYRKSAIVRGRYAGVTAAGEQTCEHVAFHQALKQAGCRIFINPKLINAGFTEHTEALRQARRAEPTVTRLVPFRHALARMFGKRRGGAPIRSDS